MRTTVRNYKKRSRVERAKVRMAEFASLSSEEQKLQMAKNKAEYDARKSS